MLLVHPVDPTIKRLERLLKYVTEVSQVKIHKRDLT